TGGVRAISFMDAPRNLSSRPERASAESRDPGAPSASHRGDISGSRILRSAQFRDDKPWRSWGSRLAGRQQAGGVLDGVDDLHVAGAAADVAAQRLPDLVLARARIAAQQAGGGHDEARCAIAALRAQFLVEAALHCRQPAALAQRLHGIDAL